MVILEKILRVPILLIVLFCIFVFSLRAEEAVEQVQVANSSASPEALRLARFRQAARAKLLSKLTHEDGAPSKIYVLPPIDYTTLQNPELITSTISGWVRQYDDRLDIRHGDFPFETLTLEQFRKAMVRLKADILIVMIMHPTNFDLYLYDKNTPWQIYAHSEALTGAAQFEVTPEVANYYTKILIRRTLYRYIKNQFYELPRDNRPPILKTEIPRYIASQESLAMVNREMQSNWYGAVSLGAALTAGTDNRFWNANLISLQVGRKIYDRFYGELAAELSSINAGILSVKYNLFDRDDVFRLSVGLGGAVGTNRRVLNWDQNDTFGPLGSTATFVVPSLSVMFPIVDVYLKAETRLYVGLPERRYIWTIMPGILVLF